MNLERNFKCIILICSMFLLSQCSSNSGEVVDSTVRSSSSLFGKCDHRGHPDSIYKQCREWTGAGFENFNLEASCDAIENGNYAEGFCPMGELVGVCILNSNQLYETKFYYYADVWDTMSAEENCVDKDLTEVTGNTSSLWVSTNQYRQN